MERVYSVGGVPIRLTWERWVHIVENHDELAGSYHKVLEAVAEPDILLAGTDEELLAVRRQNGRSLIVVYKEISDSDGFVVTAFETSKTARLFKSRKIVWRRKPSQEP